MTTPASCQPEPSSMGLILRRCTPFKVAEPVVCLPPVAVIDLKGQLLPEKSVEHKAMHGARPLMSVEAQDDDVIPRSATTWTKDAASPDSHYATQRGDGIDMLVANNWTPFFSGEFFGGKFLVSHCEPPVKVPVVRPVLGATNSVTGRFQLYS